MDCASRGIVSQSAVPAMYLAYFDLNEVLLAPELTLQIISDRVKKWRYIASIIKLIYGTFQGYQRAARRLMPC